MTTFINSIILDGAQNRKEPKEDEMSCSNRHESWTLVLRGSGLRDQLTTVAYKT